MQYKQKLGTKNLMFEAQRTRQETIKIIKSKIKNLIFKIQIIMQDG